MSTELKIIDPAFLNQEDRTELDTNIESMIASFKSNRQEINRLVFESVSALTMGENYEQELAQKKGLRRLLGGITGSNKRLQDKINHNRAIAQYAAQQTIQRLAEQNLMTFDLITAVNNKLNASVVAIEGEINEVYATLAAFFKQSRSDVIQLENRVERLERNVNLLNWQNSIEYQLFDGVEYTDLDDTTKIVCLVRDFYDITKGNWTTSDLLLLKTAMGTIGISPKANIGLFDFIKSIDENSHLRQHLLGGLQISRMPEAYLIPLCGMKKLELLSGEEQYVVETITDELSQQGIRMDEALLREELTKKYIRQEATVDMGMTVNSYDLILEMLFNLREACDRGLLVPENADSDADDSNDTEDLDALFYETSELFRTYHPVEVRPLLEKLSDAGYGKANALLYWLLCDGYYENGDYIKDDNLAKDYLKVGYDSGECISSLLYALFYDSPDEKLVKQFLPYVQELAEQGDIFAEYALGVTDLNNACGEIDYFSAVQHFLTAYQTGFYRAAGSVFLRYYNGDEPFKKDWVQGLLWGLEVLKYGCPNRVFDFAYMLMNIENFGCTDDNEKQSAYEMAIEQWVSLTELGQCGAPTNLGWMYEVGRGTPSDLEKAAQYYSIAAERGDNVGQCNLAYCYLNGRGVPCNREEAKYWLKKSAEQGNQRAKDLLKENFS